MESVLTVTNVEDLKRQLEQIQAQLQKTGLENVRHSTMLESQMREFAKTEARIEAILKRLAAVEGKVIWFAAFAAGAGAIVGPMLRGLLT